MIQDSLILSRNYYNATVFPVGEEDYEETSLPSMMVPALFPGTVFFLLFCWCVMYIQKSASNTRVQSGELSQAERLHTTTTQGRTTSSPPDTPWNHNAEF